MKCRDKAAGFIAAADVRTIHGHLVLSELATPFPFLKKFMNKVGITGYTRKLA